MSSGGHKQAVAEVIDKLLAADKSLSGTPVWRDGNRANNVRFAWPVLVEGETARVEVTATAKLETKDLHFSISLNAMNASIWRLDYDLPHKLHVNPLEPGNGLSGLRIYGPHFHAWQDNRHKATPATLPKTLDWRRELPPEVRTWDNAFRWFLGQTNIAQPRFILGYPTREMLPL